MRRIIYHKPTKDEWQLALDNEKLLNRFVKTISLSIDPNLLSFNELKSFGWEGLLQAAQNWDPKKGRFSTIAWFCVKNSVSLGIHEELVQRGRLAGKKGRLEPEDLGWLASLEEMFSQEASARNLGEMTETFSPTDGNSNQVAVAGLVEPDFSEESDDLIDLYDSMDKLSFFERVVTSLHYFGTRDHPEGMTTREIGAALHRSSPWVSSVLRRALQKMRVLIEAPAAQGEAA